MLDKVFITAGGGSKVGYTGGDALCYEKYKHLEFVCAKKGMPSLKICAPLKDMEVKENQRVEGYKIKNIPDPVVLQPVRGGFLVVACWGNEASDEIVVNEKFN